MNVNSLSQLPPASPLAADTAPIANASGDFANLLETMLGKVNDMQQNGEQAITKLQSGEASQPVTNLNPTGKASPKLRF